MQKILFSILLLLVLILVFGCAEEAEKPTKPIKKNMTAPQQQQMQPNISDTESQQQLCGDGTCDDAEKISGGCPQDCNVTATETEETEEEAEEEEEVSDDILVNIEQNLYKTLDNEDDTFDTILKLFDPLYSYLESKEEDMDEDDYDDLDDAIDAYYADVEDSIQELQDKIDLLYADVNELTTATIDDFHDDLEAIREEKMTLQGEVQENIEQFSLDIYEVLDLEGSDLRAKMITFSALDEEYEASYTITVRNVGNEDVEDEFIVYVRLEIEGESVGTCQEEIDSIAALEDEEVTCDFAVEEYYEELEDEEEASLSVELDVEIDSEDDISELDEDNNGFEFKDTWTLERLDALLE